MLIHPSPWVTGTRTEKTLGPVRASAFVLDVDSRANPEALEKAEDQVYEALRVQSAAMGGNAVVGFEMHMDPFAQDEHGRPGTSFHAVGTAARLVSLF